MSDYCLGYRAVWEALRERLTTQASGPIQLLSGPRQVGKTTLLLELAEELGDRAIYAAADGAEASLPGFIERLFEQAIDKPGAVLMIDEIHAAPDWSTRLKAEWDRAKRSRARIQVVATGSSALHLGAGSKESLAGRFERLVLSHWDAAALHTVFGLERDAAAEAIVREGAYPGAFPFRRNAKRWRAYLRDAIVEPAIGRDLLALGEIRRPALLRQIFAIATSSPAQICSLQKLQGQLQDKGALETIAHYLSLLESAFLVAPIQKLAETTARRRAAPPKLITLSNALLAAMEPVGAPTAAKDPARFGAWLENAVIAHAVNAGQRVSYWREEPLEVDAVIDGSWGKWLIEVKTGPFDPSGLKGLFELHRRHRSYKPLVVGDAAAVLAATRAGAEAKRWEAFLHEGP
jgi:uncharacterized protein